MGAKSADLPIYFRSKLELFLPKERYKKKKCDHNIKDLKKSSTESCSRKNNKIIIYFRKKIGINILGGYDDL